MRSLATAPRSVESVTAMQVDATGRVPEQKRDLGREAGQGVRAHDRRKSGPVQALQTPQKVLRKIDSETGEADEAGKAPKPPLSGGHSPLRQPSEGLVRAPRAPHGEVHLALNSVVPCWLPLFGPAQRVQKRPSTVPPVAAVVGRPAALAVAPTNHLFGQRLVPRRHVPRRRCQVASAPRELQKVNLVKTNGLFKAPSFFFLPSQILPLELSLTLWVPRSAYPPIRYKVTLSSHHLQATAPPSTGPPPPVSLPRLLLLPLLHNRAPRLHGLLPLQLY